MKRVLLRSTHFVRAAQRLTKKDSKAAASLKEALVALADDALQPALKTHKLKGDLAGSWACTAGDDLRIVFSFVEYDDAEAILLHSVGSHDEVY